MKRDLKADLELCKQVESDWEKVGTRPWLTPPNPKYKVIYADPPWEYRQSGSKKMKRGMAKQHYRTMPTDEICGLPIQSLAAEDALLFLWATFPNISEALKVMEAWGFQYKTAAFVWVKKNRKAGTNFWGMGAYTRANAEVVLLGVSPKTKARQVIKRHDIHQIVEAPVGRHSAKPDEVRQRIVDLCGDVPRVELFAREKPDGWDVWGDEVASDFVMVNRYHLKEDK